MRQWDVFINPSARLREQIPYVVLVQSDLLSHLQRAGWRRCAATPSWRRPARFGACAASARRGESLLLLPQETAPVLTRVLGKPVANLHADSTASSMPSTP